MTTTDSDSTLRTPHTVLTSSVATEPGKHGLATPHSAVADSNRRPLWARFRAEITPPEIWSTPRPALRDLWLYAAHAPWSGQGPLRFAGKAYAVLLSLPAHAAAYYALWLVERPSRLIFTVLLLVAIGHM